MATGTQPVAATRTLPEFCELAGLGDAAKVIVQPTYGPAAYVAALVERKLFPDAVRFVAHALPKREGIWWAWVCARRVAGPAPPPAIQAALDATERWITQPTDEHRRAAMRAAEAATFTTPAGCTALAVFFSGGSIAPPDAPHAPPSDLMSARIVTGAVIAAAVSAEPARAPEKFRAFIQQGVDVANKLGLWNAA